MHLCVYMCVCVYKCVCKEKSTSSYRMIQEVSVLLHVVHKNRTYPFSLFITHTTWMLWNDHWIPATHPPHTHTYYKTETIPHSNQQLAVQQWEGNEQNKHPVFLIICDYMLKWISTCEMCAGVVTFTALSDFLHPLVWHGSEWRKFMRLCSDVCDLLFFCCCADCCTGATVHQYGCKPGSKLSVSSPAN